MEFPFGALPIFRGELLVSDIPMYPHEFFFPKHGDWNLYTPQKIEILYMSETNVK